MVPGRTTAHRPPAAPAAAQSEWNCEPGRSGRPPQAAAWLRPPVPASHGRPAPSRPAQGRCVQCSRSGRPGRPVGPAAGVLCRNHRAAAIAAGLAGAGVASEPAALAFVPLAGVRSDLVIPKSAGGSREVQGLLKVLSSPWLIDQLASLPGYDPSHCGEHFT